MQRAESPDRLTVIAIALAAYAWVNFCHEIVGHCSVAALMGTKCRLISSTNIPLVTMPPEWKYNVIVVAGSAANWAFAFVCLGLLRALPAAPPGLRHFLWLSMCVNLFTPATYMTAAPVIKYGDSYILISKLPNQLFWRSAVVLTGAVVCWLSFRLCRAELGRLLGRGGRAARPTAWALVAPAYVAGGVLTVASGLFSQLPAKVAQLQAVGGTFGLMFWLLLLPFGIPEQPTPAPHPFTLPRSVWWIAAGASCALIFVFVLGPGVPV